MTGGADIHAANRRGYQAIHEASVGNADLSLAQQERQAETLKILIARGARLDTFNKNGMTPMHIAIRCRSILAVETLIKAGSSRVLTNRNGTTPLKLAQVTSGKCGSGTDCARAAQIAIIKYLS